MLLQTLARGEDLSMATSTSAAKQSKESGTESGNQSINQHEYKRQDICFFENQLSLFIKGNFVLLLLLEFYSIELNTRLFHSTMKIL